MKALEKLLIHISSFIFGVILLLTFASVFFRYILNDSIVWAEEVIRYAFIWMFFLSMPEVTRTASHIALDFIPTHLHGNLKIILDIIIEIINNVFLVLVVYYGMKITFVNMAQGSPALQIPYGCVYAAIPIGGVLMILFSIQRIYGILKSKLAGG
jgi:TRAP-type C4-dicarboxylate transport system permease small subunit